MSLNHIVAGNPNPLNAEFNDLKINGSLQFAGSINYANLSVSGLTTVNNLDINGNVNVSSTISGSARYNIDSSSRPGIIGGYLILAADPNPSYIPFNMGPPQGIFDYANPNSAFILSDPFTITFNQSGNYSISFGMIVVGTAPTQTMFQLQSSQFPFGIGGVPPMSDSFGSLQIITLLPLPPPYDSAFVYNATCNAAINAGDFIRLAYLTNANAEISLSSNLSITKIV